MRPRTRDDFQIAIICALTLEADAVEALFDEPYDKFGSIYPKQSGDQNAYITGRIGPYNVVLCYLPGMGIGSAASAAANLRVSYEQVKLALLVGICGAVPFLPNNDEVVLGDIIISDSVIQYDFGSQYHNGFRRKTDVKETLGRPSQEIRGFLAALRGRKTRSDLQEQTYKYLQTLQPPSETEWQYPGTEHDVLYEASYRHKHYRQNPDTKCTTCSNCKSSDDPICDEALKEDCKRTGCDASSIPRSRLSANSVQPRVHIGTIASANTVMKSGEHRDKLVEMENVIGFEMEGAGVWDNLPCIIVKGVCDYADSHKNKKWQDYAAATAASCAKAFLGIWPVTTTKSLKPMTFLVPFERNEDFVGRESQLQELEDGLFVDGRFSKMALFALGGMGKTSIALELIYRIRDKYPSCSIFWVTSTSAESFEQSCRKIGQKLELPGMEDQTTDVKKIVMNYLNDEKSGQWIVVFDNADDFDIWFTKSTVEGSVRLADYIPSNTRGCALLTTRSEKVARSFARHSVLKVSEMGKSTSLSLLKKSLGPEEFLSSDDNTTELLEKLCFIPLAIVQAAAYMTLNYATILNYLSLLNDTEESLVDTLSEDFEDNWRYRDQSNPIVTTWIVSFTQIQRQNPLAADYLSFISCIEPKAIPLTLLPPGGSSKEQLEAIACLRSYSFLAKQVDGNFDMHQLVHLVIRNWLKTTSNYENSYGLVISRFTEVFPKPDLENRDVWRIYLPHMKYTMSLDRIQITVDRKLLITYGQCLLSDGRYLEAELPLTEAAKVAMQELGAEHPETLASLFELASTYSRQGRYKEAEELNLQVIETAKTVLGAKHPTTLSYMKNLVLNYLKQGRWKEAEGLNLQAIEICKTVLGAEHPDTLTSIAIMALVYWNQGKLNEAEELNLQVIETAETVLGTKHPTTLSCMNNLASIYFKQGRWKEAERLNLQAVEIFRTVLGAEHPDTLTCISNLASTYRNQGRLKEAEDLEVQIMEIRRTVLGSEHPDTLISMNNLALLYQKQDRWNEAEKLNLQAMETCKTVLGAEHPDTLISMSNLARIRISLGRTEDAALMMMTVYQLRLSKLGPDHPSTQSTLDFLVQWNTSMEKQIEARRTVQDRFSTSS